MDEKERYQRELYEMSMCCTGLSFSHLYWTTERLSKSSGNEMQYSSNNGVFAFVDKYGDTYILPYNKDVEAKLYFAGYREGSVFVPMSNGEEIIKNDRFKARWKEILEKKRKKETYSFGDDDRLEELILEDIKRISKNKGIKTLPENVYEFSIDINSLKFVNEKGEEKSLPKSYLVYDEILKTTNTGTYNILNGNIVFIDENGKTFFAPTNPYIEDQLKKCGFILDATLEVPFINGEKIVDDEVVSKKYEKLKEISKRFTEDQEYEELYINMIGSYERLTIDSRVLDEEIEREMHFGSWQKELKDEKARELKKLKAMKEEISALLASKKVVRPKELKAIVAKYGTLDEDGFKLYPEEPKKQEKAEVQEAVTEPENVETVSTDMTEDEKRQNIISEKIKEIADRRRIKKVESLLQGWLVNIEGLEDDRGVKYKSYLEFNIHTMQANIGTYYSNNGTIVIVDADGKTFVAPLNRYIVNTLICNGFTEKSMFVPLSNGETIINNEEAKMKFDKLRSISRRKLQTEKYASNVTIDRLEEKYIEISNPYRREQEKVEQKRAQLKFKKQSSAAYHTQKSKLDVECNKHYRMIEDLLRACGRSIAVETSKISQAMSSYEFDSEEKLSI